MRISTVEIENFRGVKTGRVTFPEHALLIGPNNVGKSTVLEALDLALGPDRLSGPSTIDEHDFHLGRYVAEASSVSPTDGAGGDTAKAPEIKITVTLSGLSAEDLTRFRARVEVWNSAEGRVFSPEEAVSLTPTLANYVLRVQFRGWYESEEDEFKAETVFVNAQREDGSFDTFGKVDKRRIGFLYLRALRTARRAASLQRGSMLDLLLTIAEAEPRFWREVIASLNALGETTSKEPGLRGILDEIDTSINEFIPTRKPGAPLSRLNVTELTREQLRTVMTYFLADHASGHLLPYDRLGSGVTNLLVLALLTLMAGRKQNVIFAMEEPEIALGPTVQRRIVAKLRRVAAQSLVTSHSPYVAEQFLPDSIVVLRRSGGTLDSHTTSATPELKEKIVLRERGHHDSRLLRQAERCEHACQDHCGGRRRPRTSFQESREPRRRRTPVADASRAGARTLAARRLLQGREAARGRCNGGRVAHMSPQHPQEAQRVWLRGAGPREL